MPTFTGVRIGPVAYQDGEQERQTLLVEHARARSLIIEKRLSSETCFEFGYDTAVIDQRERIEADTPPTAPASPWINVKDRLPGEGQMVWGINPEQGTAVLVCRIIDVVDGWCWAMSNGTTYIEDGEIVAECEAEELDITHWMPLPNLPTP
jgi:hypothetical protein